MNPKFLTVLFFLVMLGFLFVIFVKTHNDDIKNQTTVIAPAANPPADATKVH